ncbi:biotin--[acetyl-CoA-carboxylase] ligase [Campylobacter ureolyticus]|uniref:Biotin-[acetyl-CoA-carboxylase] ligase n=1 Tax=Campylobacter ureolyticus TaxID=827 RepID=A0AAE7E9E0_9BACT|nr:biotin--[acetyl-CoA-carboxylase] ligase [Campylobacter ureolyticus]MCR8684634.1 biotin--[acetyl-CoA-carboxylase] ligase [Campylobacter ureolyticus]QKF84076.1 biotin-[acetyl-CoA-carboxylase] ligase [Campylobacter ureolyticus]QQY35778.1 biotin--[acetyl-CoA-carboxylase] ligase [Campylobacter ureolyticus]SUX24107.1 biotin--protein ligase [Campylobacter ureolyticus]
MQIFHIQTCASTQSEILEILKDGVKSPPFAIVSKMQTNGVGSRGNNWQSCEGNLFLSFCIHKNDLNSDINTSSLSIYFSYIFKIILSELGSSVWVKWPNDFYIGKDKIGGVITTKFRDIYICGIGLNLASNGEYTKHLDIKVDIDDLLIKYFKKLEEKISWKQIFSKFLIEFEKSKDFCSHIDGRSVLLKNAILCDDGSILIDNKKVYSLR